MKPIILSALTFIFLTHTVFCQNKTEVIIPDSTYFVFSADLGRIVKSMPVKDMNEYPFVQQIVRKITGSNKENLAIEDIGVDFSSSIHAFAGLREFYDFTGVSIRLKDKQSFLSNDVVPNDFQQSLKDKGYAFDEYKLALLKNNTFVLIDLKWKLNYFEDITDSIFDANNWERPYRYKWNDWENYEHEEYDYTEEYMDLPPPEEIEAEEEIIDEENYDEDIEIIVEDEAYEEDTSYNYDDEYEAYYDSQEEDMYMKYDQILDSVKESHKPKITMSFIRSLEKGESLAKSDQDFESTREQLADGAVYLNSSLMNSRQPDYYSYNPYLKAVNKFNDQIWQSGYLNFTKTGVTIDWNTHADDKFMKVIEASLSTKVNTDLLAYIPETTQGFGIYNLNGLGAYNEMKETYMPILDDSKNPEYLLASAIWSTIDELVDEEAIFDIYTANMFVTYNGMQKMMLEKTTYDYDEETYEYTEKTENYEEMVPVMSFGIHTEKAYLLEKYMKAWEAYDDFDMEKIDGYYKLEKGPIGGMAYYLAIIDDIILVTNDEDLVKNNLNGYGKNALSGDAYKKAKNSRFIYAKLDMSNFPEDLKPLSPNRNDRKFIDALEDKMGAVELELKEVTENKQTLQMTYSFDGKYKNGAYYMMDLMNTIFEENDSNDW
ncbi:MAG: hypothetical protein WED10_05415 [Brumimicrobium sp.]